MSSEPAPATVPVQPIVRRRVPLMMMFSNGAIAAFDERDEQIPELQMRSAIELWAEYAAANGFDVDGCEVRTQSPGGDGHRLRRGGGVLNH